MSNIFSSLPLSKEILGNLNSLEFKSMTSIQAQSLPSILSGKDVIAQGHTGSGKTVAFGLGLIAKLNTKNFNIQALVLCPTRELADQVSAEIRKLARTIPNVKVIALYGGTPLRSQAESLAKGVHIAVGTPGRIEDHLEKKTINLSDLNTLVLDEADRMLDMGFQQTLDAIIEQLPEKRQTLLFSATFPDQIKKIAERVTLKATFASVTPDQDSVRVDQQFYQVNDELHRQSALESLLLHRQDQHQTNSTVVFCNTRKDAQSIAGKLKSSGFSAAALHGDMEQKDRDQTLVRFSNKSILTLVATDVAARGLDIENLDLVVNFHLARELDVYVHRIGRTGRAGAKGTAYSLFNKQEKFRLDQLSTYLKKDNVISELPPIAQLNQTPTRAPMSTIRLEGGKKQKVRPGDIVGALTSNTDIDGKQLGKIQVSDNWSYIAIKREIAKLGLQTLNNGKLKGKSFRARLV